jgi:hypothetical protein
MGSDLTRPKLRETSAHMQLDLFTHGRDVMLQNDVIAALRERDAASGRNALERFATEDVPS